MIILNVGAVPVRVAGQYLQPGESMAVADDVAARLMAANPGIVAAGSGPKEANAANDKPTEDLPAVAAASPAVGPGKRKK